MAQDSTSEDGGSRRGSMSMDHVATLTPTPSPQHPRSSYPADYRSNSHPSTNHAYNGHHPSNPSSTSSSSSTSSVSSSLHYPPQDHHSNHIHQQHQQQQQQQQQQHLHHHQHQHQHQQPTPTTPSPPLPSPSDAFHGRPLPPIEPSHPLHSYMSNSRRGSLADPADFHGPADVHRRPSDASSYYPNGSSSSSSDPHHRHYATSSPSSASTAASSSEHHLHHHQHHSPQQQHSQPPPPPSQHYHPHPSTSPMHLRQSENISARRESLPSIHSSAGPLGQLLAQEPQRRHSIAHSDPVGPLKRKTSSTPLSQVHSPVALDHPAKRRDSIPDAAMPSSLHPYPPRSSYSAPSSPPRRGSIASPAHGNVPILNLQPAAEIKPSLASPSNGHPGLDHGRPHFPLHQPRRPSLLSESGAALSRRSSLADPYHAAHYHPYQQQAPQPSIPPPSSSSSSVATSHHQAGPQSHPSQDYDHHMQMDMENMHLNNQGPEVASTASVHNSHLHPGYHAGYPEGGTKGDTPYSRSPELRVSHKLAERKRRKEMKELFDELRDSLPVDRSLKTSKWEILSKAVDYIGNMKANQDEMAKEIEMLRQEVNRLNNSSSSSSNGNNNNNNNNNQ
ncbi:hypothetical protein BGZ94_003654 [Podila epigama]|nr:hypothetical protein BGZ94_003654 [Podila epigama]